MWCLCLNCINAIKSRGEKIFVGSIVDPDEYLEENGLKEPEILSEKR